MNKQRQSSSDVRKYTKSMRNGPRKSGIARLQTNNNMQAIGCVFTNIYIYIYIYIRAQTMQQVATHKQQGKKSHAHICLL